MSKRDVRVHSRWACRRNGCDWTYEAPLAGQEVLWHRAVDGGKTVGHGVRRVWESKYNKIGRQ